MKEMIVGMGIAGGLVVFGIYILPVIFVLLCSVFGLFGGLLFDIGTKITKKMWSYKEEEVHSDGVD